MLVTMMSAYQLPAAAPAEPEEKRSEDVVHAGTGRGVDLRVVLDAIGDGVREGEADAVVGVVVEGRAEPAEAVAPAHPVSATTESARAGTNRVFIPGGTQGRAAGLHPTALPSHDQIDQLWYDPKSKSSRATA